jgi:hypothetical protein
MTFGVEVIGPFRGPTGHDRHTREFIRQLVRRGARVQLVPLHGWSADLPAGVREPWFDQLLAPVGTSLSLHFTMPSLCRPRAGRVNVNYTMFEADRIPADWAARAAAHERILVPTEACRQAWIDSGVAAEKVRVSPLGVDGDFFAQPAAPLPLVLPNGRPVASYSHRFLNIADLRPRKNHLGLLRSWLRATTAADDAVLLLKCTNPHPHSLAQFHADLADLQRAIGRSFETAAPVLFMTGILGDEELRSLYRTATHYFSMSCGEGWDFPMMESAVARLQLIAPWHSAYRTYLTADDAELIPAPAVPAVIEGRAGAEDHIFFDGSRWWRPDEDAAVAVLQKILRGESAPKRSPGERIRREYSWNRAGETLFAHLAELA